MTYPAPPPDTRAAGQNGHIADHNTIADSLTALESAVGGLQLSQSNPALAPTTVQASAYTASPYDLVVCDVSGGGFTVKLPQTAPNAARVGFKLVNVSSSAQNALTVQCQGSDVINKAGGPTSATMILLNQGAVYQYDAALQIWYITGDDLPASAVLPVVASVQALSGGSTVTVPFSAVRSLVPVTETGNVTGIILAAPAAGNAQRAVIINRSAFTITFAASGTSHVADGTSDVIPALTGRGFTYDPSTSLWYRDA
jgi:hypothetical protein